jgi:hypothetical protein
MAHKITVEEALQALPDDGPIHTQLESRTGLLLGADWDRAEIEREIRDCGWAMPTTGMAKRCGKGIVVRMADGCALFVQTREGWEAPVNA